MIEQGITFPDVYKYRLIVPAALKTHDPDYLTRVNNDFSTFLSEVDSQNVFKVGDLYIIRNISPHGLGGILVFDASGKNFFELTVERQRAMEDFVDSVSRSLETQYGEKFHIVVGMATSSNPGGGMGQSIAFAHMHISLLPKEVSAGENVHGVQVEVSDKIIPYTTFTFDGFVGNQLTSREGGAAFYYDSGYPLRDFQEQNATRITDLLSAKDDKGGVYGTQWAIHRGSGRRRTLGVCPGIGYLPALGAGLRRSTEVSEGHLQDFENFNKSVFEYLKSQYC